MRMTLLFLLLAAGLQATEKASPLLQQSRRTSTSREISLKPLFVYSARGRRDPFIFAMALPRGSALASQDFHITALNLVGFIGEGAGRMALFSHFTQGKTYKMRGGQLYTSENIALSDVKGSFVGDRNVNLVQGESSILYRLPIDARMQSIEASMSQDRKEPQR